MEHILYTKQNVQYLIKKQILFHLCSGPPLYNILSFVLPNRAQKSRHILRCRHISVSEMSSCTNHFKRNFDLQRKHRRAGIMYEWPSQNLKTFNQTHVTQVKQSVNIRTREAQSCIFLSILSLLGV